MLKTTHVSRLSRLSNQSVEALLASGAAVRRLHTIDVTYNGLAMLAQLDALMGRGAIAR